jgi:hypothetical protein
MSGSSVPLNMMTGIGRLGRHLAPAAAGMLAMRVPAPANSSEASHSMRNAIMPPLEMPTR